MNEEKSLGSKSESVGDFSLDKHWLTASFILIFLIPSAVIAVTGIFILIF